MPVLEGTIKRYIGLSTETKPNPYDGSLLDGETLPAGSTFLESDTFRIARWDGGSWSYERDDMAVVAMLGQIVDLLRATNEQLELIRDRL